MSLKKEEKQALDKIVNKVKDEFVIKQIVLFGSKARNDDSADSDVDVILLVENPVDDKARWNLSDIVTEVEWDTDIYISCRIYNYNDWEKENEDVIFYRLKITLSGMVNCLRYSNAVKILLHKSKNNYESALSDFEAGRYDTCVSGLYYSCFQSVVALMILKGQSERKHTNVRAFVNKELARKGFLEKRLVKF